jgi:O-antigen/teichoic acid export membrane protein
MALMLFVRPLSALGGLVALVVLSRVLSATDYGGYFAFWAVVEILILLSNLGLLHSAYRYVSATEWTNGQIEIDGPVNQLFALRIVSLSIVSALLLLLPDLFSSLIPTKGLATALIPVVALITFCEGLTRYLEVLFDSMLFQKSSLFTLLARTLIRLTGFSYLFFSKTLSLEKVLAVEALAAFIGMCLAIVILLNLRSRCVPSKETKNTELLSFSRISKFALPAYATQALGTSYGPDSLKLALGSVAGSASVALFGFAYSLASIVQRYMPANIFAGILRPVFVAASHKPEPEKVLSELLSVSIKLNWVFILPIFCFLFFGANTLLSQLSAGNYANAGAVTTYIILGLLAIAVHLNLSMYCLAKECSWPPLFATIASTLGLPIGLVLAEHYGAVGVAIAFGLSEVIWSATCLIVIKASAHHRLWVDWLGFLKIVLIAAGAVMICVPIYYYWPNYWFAPSLLAPCIFIVALHPAGVFSRQETVWLLSVLPIHKLPFLKK